MTGNVARSSRPEVRNPILELPEVKELIELSTPEQRAVWFALLMRISATGHERGEKAWRTRKGPMAVYWRGLGVYAKHIARAIRP